MAVYAWRGRNVRGESVQGQLDAPTENGAADQLIAMGVAPVHIEVAAASAEVQPDSWWVRINRKPIGVEDILLFSRQMYTLNKAGIPIFRSFAGLVRCVNEPSTTPIRCQIDTIFSDLPAQYRLSGA